MLEKNVDLVLEKITSSDIVLDIGGWAQPFNRANYILDIMPYESRGFYGHLGPEKEYFLKDTWILHDVSSRKPLPFKDKEIDYVICSQTLEDIRDPIHLCSEIIRIGRGGYIEVPSRIVESTQGHEGRKYAGYYHHRWLIEIINSEITFRFKTALLNNSWKFHFPKSYLRKLNKEDHVSWLFWDNTFQYKEVIQISELLLAQELKEYVKRYNVYPKIYYLINEIKQGLRSNFISLSKSMLKKSPRLKKAAETRLGRNIHVQDTDSFWSDIPEIHSK